MNSDDELTCMFMQADLGFNSIPMHAKPKSVGQHNTTDFVNTFVL